MTQSRSAFQATLCSAKAFFGRRLYDPSVTDLFEVTCEDWSPTSSSIRIVCISDTHNSHDEISPLPEGDILIHAGDLTERGTVKELDDALSWMNNLPFLHKVYIAGNHDIALTEPETRQVFAEKYPDLIYLQDSTATVTVRDRSLTIYGNPSTPSYPGWSAFKHPIIESKDIQTEAELVYGGMSKGVDVVVTHGPPAYYLDATRVWGCKGLLCKLWSVRPALHVFGHVHDAHGVAVLDWSEAQAATERFEIGSGSWSDLLLLARTAVWRKWTRALGRANAADSDEQNQRQTILVNASISPHRCNLPLRDPIVVDI